MHKLSVNQLHKIAAAIAADTIRKQAARDWLDTIGEASPFAPVVRWMNPEKTRVVAHVNDAVPPVPSNFSNFPLSPVSPRDFMDMDHYNRQLYHMGYDYGVKKENGKLVPDPNKNLIDYGYGDYLKKAPGTSGSSHKTVFRTPASVHRRWSPSPDDLGYAELGFPGRR